MAALAYASYEWVDRVRESRGIDNIVENDLLRERFNALFEP